MYSRSNSYTALHHTPTKGIWGFLDERTALCLSKRAFKGSRSSKYTCRLSIELDERGAMQRSRSGKRTENTT